MNNTIRRNLTIVAVLMAATLVVGTFATTITITQTAFAFSKKKGGDENSRNGNTITIQKCKQAATQSGFDNSQGQECENLICTHPSENAACVSEGRAAAVPTNLTCEQCFTKFLTTAQISKLLSLSPEFTTLGQLCGLLPEVRAVDLQLALGRIGVSASVAAQLIQCLLNAGIVFSTTSSVIR
jgi:hypothetical protein